ncbi:ABC transporter ATP-binding protein [Microbacterium sp. LWH3-1.2]|uniref:ABC transporter ATP-binding protein n=1 Tax=Microbacterium sp. LWH3-1.2 TaxID=3135256 RepID=UPI00342DD3FD
MTLLEIDSIGISVTVGGEGRVIVRDVSLAVEHGESLSLVGESGSGKSMTLKAILGLLPSTATVTGMIRFDGVDVLGLRGRELRAFLSRDVASVFQNPQASINPLARIGDFVCESLIAARGLSRRAAYDRAVATLESVGVSDAARRMNQYPHELSGGLLQRVMISQALVSEPRLLLADEPTTALDVTTQEEVMAILNEQRQRRGLAMIFVTHDLDLAAAGCDRIAVMYAGSIVETLPARGLHSSATHPYTKALLAARPGIGSTAARSQPIPGQPVAAFQAPSGCPFHPRCPRATEVCRVERPALRSQGVSVAACHHPVLPIQEAAPDQRRSKEEE